MPIAKHHKMNCFNTILGKDPAVTGYCWDWIMAIKHWSAQRQPQYMQIYPQWVLKCSLALKMLQRILSQVDLSEKWLVLFSKFTTGFLRFMCFWREMHFLFKGLCSPQEKFINRSLLNILFYNPIVSLQYLQIKTMIQTIFFSICLVKFQFSPAAAKQFMWESHNESNWSQ